MAQKENAPLGNLLGTIGLVAGFIAGWNISDGNFVGAFITAVIVGAVGVFLGNLAWRILVIAASVVVAVISNQIRHEVVKGVVEGVTQGQPQASNPAPPTYIPAPPQAVVQAPSAGALSPSLPAPFAAESRECARHAMSNFLSHMRIARERTAPGAPALNNQQRVDWHAAVQADLEQTDVTRCPEDFRIAYQNVIHSSAEALDASRRRMGVSGTTAWLGGVSDEQYDAIRGRMRESMQRLEASGRAHVPEVLENEW